MSTKPLYYCIAHQACSWELPDFMTMIGTGNYSPDTGISMSKDFPELANKNNYLGEYVALFAIRKILLESNSTGFIGLCHYRRFALPKPLGELRGFNFHAPPDVLKDLKPDDFFGTGMTPIIPAVVHFTGSVLQQYAASCVARDLLMFFGDAVDCNIITSNEAANFLSNNAFITAPTVAYIPVEWFTDIVNSLEIVMTHYYTHHYIERTGYLERSMAFCCERLQAFLLAKKANEWGFDKLISQPLTLII